MILIIGGAYQGKLDFAKANLGIREDQICDCGRDPADFSKKCLWHVEQLCLECVQKGIDPREYFLARRSQWQNSVLICRDIFCGVVPVDDTCREWRQATARLCQYLSAEADQVSRIFCGLEQRLK